MSPEPVTLVPKLVPGRACDACTVCCAVPAIDTPELRKQAGVLCGFCAPGRGCTLYPDWPPVCRAWFCGWRSLPLLDEAWRPDRCGLMIVLGDDPIPPGLSPYDATKFVVTGDGTFLADRRFLSYVSALVHAGAATYLAAQGPPGHHPLKALLNPPLLEAAARRDGGALRDGVRTIYEALRRGPFEPAVLQAPSAPAGDQPPPPAM